MAVKVVEKFSGFKLYFFFLSVTPLHETMQAQDLDFSDIRPFHDDEVPAAIERVLQNKSFEKLVEFVYPETPREQIYRMMRACRNVFDFQKNISRTAVKAVLKRSSEGLSYSGFENIDPNSGHLFISNHRDIILDSAILNISLIDEGIPSTETAIGSNLLSFALAEDLSKLNKNFIVKRNVPQKEMYNNSHKLSAYIHSRIAENTSVWLAQREGRSKDGIDRTQPGLLKMLTIGFEGAYADCFHSLRLLPMTISYEFDPCDFLKARELKTVRNEGSYTKGKNEDLQSMITGVLGRKGRIHLQVGAAFDDAIETLREERNKNEKIRMLAEIIDSQINRGYKLWPNNYVAHDMLHASDTNRDYYTSEDRERFEAYIQHQLSQLEQPDDTDREILLGIYANAVDRVRESLGSSTTSF